MTTYSASRPPAMKPKQMTRIPLLQLWRGEHPLHIAAPTVAELRNTLGKVYLLEFPRWPSAVAGNGGAAACIGIYVASDKASPAWLVDLVGSVLLLCAAEGSGNAAVVLRHLRARHSKKNQRSHFADGDCARSSR